MQTQQNTCGMKVVRALGAALLGMGVVTASAGTAHAMAKPTKERKAVRDQLAALKPKPIEKLTPAVAQRQPLPSNAVAALLKTQGRSTAPEPVGSVINTKGGAPHRQ